MLKLTPFILLLLLLPQTVVSQSAQTENQQANDPLEFTVSVTNKRGSFVKGLKPGNFLVYIDKIQQTIEEVSEGDEPISIGIMVDASASMDQSETMQNWAQLISRFQSLSNKQNEYFLLAFNITPELLMDWGPSVEPGLEKLITIKPKRNTAFFDAFYVAAEKVSRGRHRKRALIVISDGMDNLSRYSFKDVREFLRETDIIVHAVALTINPAGSILAVDGMKILDELVDLSGGMIFFTNNPGRWPPDDLRQAFEMLAGSLRSQYRIRVTPVYRSTEKWHRLKIKLNVSDPRKEFKGLSAVAREGFYFVPAQLKQ